MTHYITFPGLFDDILTVPTETFFGIKIYAVMIMVGFLLAAIYAMARAKEFNSDGDIIADLLIFVLPAAIIGARAYYVLHKWDYYSQHTDEIIKVWNGGIAIYGAIIASALVIVIFSKIKKIDMLSLLDLGAISLLIGQSIGRWGNFFNAEAYGTTTDLPWGMVIRKSIQTTGAAVHPTFLYESIWNAIGFVILHNYSKKRKFKGEMTLLYIAWYGLGRAFIEGLRVDSLMIGNTNIRVSQMLAIVTCVLSVIALLYFYKTKKGTPVLVSANETEVADETSTDMENAQDTVLETAEEIETVTVETEEEAENL